MKMAKMPSREEMIQKLDEAGIYGITPKSDQFFDAFVRAVAESKKIGPGLVMAWEFVNYNTLRDYPPEVQALMSMWFDTVIDIVTPDPEVAEQAKSFMREAREKARKGGG